MDKKGDIGVGEQVEGFLGGRVGGHDDGWACRELLEVEVVGGKVGVVHEGDMGDVFSAGGEVKLYTHMISCDPDVCRGVERCTKRAFLRQVTTSLGRVLPLESGGVVVVVAGIWSVFDCCDDVGSTSLHL